MCCPPKSIQPKYYWQGVCQADVRRFLTLWTLADIAMLLKELGDGKMQMQQG